MRDLIYHAITSDLLGIQPSWHALPDSLSALAYEHQINLPPAYAELCQIVGAAELLSQHSNGDSFTLAAPDVLRDTALGTLLRFMVESQGNYELAVLCDERPDPPVYYRDFTHARWIEYAESLSAAIYAQCFDWQFLVKSYGEDTDLSYGTIECPFAPEILRTLDQHARRAPQTHWYMEQDAGTVYRYALSENVRLALNCFGGTAHISVMARGDDSEVAQATQEVHRMLGLAAS